MYSGRTHFRTNRWIHLWVFAATAAMIAGASLAYEQSGATWISISLFGLALFGIAGLIENSTNYLVLDESELRMRRTFRSVSVKRDELERVVAERGCPIVLMLKDGRNLVVPSLGVRGLDDSLQAWFRGG